MSYYNAMYGVMIRLPENPPHGCHVRLCSAHNENLTNFSDYSRCINVRWDNVQNYAARQIKWASQTHDWDLNGSGDAANKYNFPVIAHSQPTYFYDLFFNGEHPSYAKGMWIVRRTSH